LQRLRARIPRPKGVARTARAVREQDPHAGVAARGRN
jgi:hypothetical protein